MTDRLIYKTGNLLDVKSGAIIHGCNCQGVMGAGVAKAIKEMYPKAYSDYHQFCLSKTTSELLGGYVSVQVTPDLCVYNALTQNKFATSYRAVSYDAIDKCFYRIFSLGLHKEFNIPFIGAGLGGGDWDIIEAIIKSNLKKFPLIKVIVWSL